MRIGKISEAVLNRSVLKEIRQCGSELITGPAVGADATVLRMGENVVVSSAVSPDIDADPEIRTLLAVHAAVNNVAASGAMCRAIVVNLVLSEGTGENVLKTIVRTAEKTAESLGLQIAGGHTTVSRSVSREVITVTGIGSAGCIRKESSGDMFCSRDIVMTKTAAIAASMLLASEYEKALSRRFTGEIIEAAKNFRNSLSVVPEATIAWADRETIRMHDVSEGGVFGALWELAEAENAGLEINLREIPVCQETVEICEFFDRNPYQSYSEGALLILSGNGRALTDKLESAGIPATVIGRTASGRDRILYNRGEVRYLDKPQQDELYKMNPEDFE